MKTDLKIDLAGYYKKVTTRIRDEDQDFLKLDLESMGDDTVRQV